MTNVTLDTADLSDAIFSNTTMAGLGAISLQGCPKKVPADWSCDETWQSGLVLYGPGANLTEANLTLGPRRSRTRGCDLV